MISVSISDFRSNLSKYLDYAASGKPVALTKRGKVVVEIRSPESSKEKARRRLQEIAKDAEVYDVESPAIDDWGSLG